MEERKRERAMQLSALLQISYHTVLFKFKSEKLKKVSGSNLRLENYLRIILYRHPVKISCYLLSEENLIERVSGLEMTLAH